MRSDTDKAARSGEPNEARRELLLARTRNALHQHYFEFAPALVRHLTCDERKERVGCLKNVTLELSGKMESAIGMCYPTRRRIALNEPYHLRNPQYLPYTLYHEMVHMFLYDAGRPWGHTREFYALMEEFPKEKYPVDPNVHIHMRQAAAGRKLKAGRDMRKAQEETLGDFIERVFGTPKRGTDGSGGGEP